MAKEKKELSAAEKKEKAKKEAREIAIKNLDNQDLTNIASAAYVDAGDYGGAGTSAVDEYLFRPSLYHSKTGSAIIEQSMIGSRQGGKWLTGNVSEYGVSQFAGKQTAGLMGGITVADAMKYVQYKEPVKDSWKGKYLSEMANGSEDEQKFVNDLLETYQLNLADLTVSKALGMRAANRTKSRLEDAVKPAEKKKKA